jgi:hypothetical protein
MELFLHGFLFSFPPRIKIEIRRTWKETAETGTHSDQRTVHSLVIPGLQKEKIGSH